MANQYYLKDKRLSLWDYKIESIKGVSKKVYFSENRLIWAYYRHNGGSGAYKNSNGLLAYDEDASAIFVINRREVPAAGLIVYDHKIYEITRIDDFEGYREDVKIIAKLASNQSFSSYSGLEDDYVTTEEDTTA